MISIAQHVELTGRTACLSGPRGQPIETKRGWCGFEVKAQPQSGCRRPHSLSFAGWDPLLTPLEHRFGPIASTRLLSWGCGHPGLRCGLRCGELATCAMLTGCRAAWAQKTVHMIVSSTFAGKAILRGLFGFSAVLQTLCPLRVLQSWCGKWSMQPKWSKL